MVYAVAYAALRDREALADRSLCSRTPGLKHWWARSSAQADVAQIACRAFADSKTLTEAKREELYGEIASDASLGFAADVLSAKTLSVKMLAA